LYYIQKTNAAYSAAFQNWWTSHLQRL